MSTLSGGSARLLALHDQITDAEFSFAVAALALLLFSFLFEVASRYFFGAPTVWSGDLVQYSMCFSVALALPAVTRDGGHVAITSFIERLSLRQRARAAKVIAGLGTVMLIGTSAIFLFVAIEQWQHGLETVAALPIPKWWLTAVVGLGFFDSSLHLMRQATGRHDLSVD